MAWRYPRYTRPAAKDLTWLGFTLILLHSFRLLGFLHGATILGFGGPAQAYRDLNSHAQLLGL